MQDQLAQIEKMLEQGMDEAQILAALGVRQAPSTPYDRLQGGGMAGAKSIGPGPAAESGPLAWVKRFVGLTDGGEINPEEGSMPLPFTDKRLKPATAAQAGMSALGGAQLLRSIPGMARELMRSPVTYVKAPKAGPAGVELDRLLGEPPTPNYPGLLTAEEGGGLAMQMLRRFSDPKPKPPLPRLVTNPTPKPTFEQIISQVLKDLYGK